MDICVCVQVTGWLHDCSGGGLVCRTPIVSEGCVDTLVKVDIVVDLALPYVLLLAGSVPIGNWLVCCSELAAVVVVSLTVLQSVAWVYARASVRHQY